MKILFISSGNANTETGLSPIIMAQGKSLKVQGMEIDYFGIKGSGALGYLKVIPKLRKVIRGGDYDVLHAHYGLSGFSAALSFSGKPLVVSLMGSDVLTGGWLKIVNALFSCFYWDKVIVKSPDMKLKSGIMDAIIQPNGVNIEHFQPKDKIECRNLLNWKLDELKILFGSNPIRPEKNYLLLEESLKSLQNLPKYKVHFLKGYSHQEIPIVLNAVDLIVLSSKWEGSPNVVKEAMACNKPILSTLVGDVPILFATKPAGCFGSSLAIEDFTQILGEAIKFCAQGENPEGRSRIKELNLDQATVAKRIISLYKEII